MKRLFFGLIALVLLLGVLLGITYVFSAILLSRGMTKQLGTKVSVSQATFGLNRISIRNITVSSPKGKIPALTVEHAYLQAPLSTYFKHVSYIEKVEIDDSILTIIFNPLKTSSNWDEITKRMNKANEKSKKKKYAMISFLEFNRLTIRVLIPGLPAQETIVPYLAFRDVKSNEGAVTQKITQIVVQQMLFNAKNLLNLPLPIPDPTKNLFKNLLP